MRSRWLAGVSMVFSYPILRRGCDPACIFGARCRQATSTGSLKKSGLVGQRPRIPHAIMGRPPGTALVLGIGRYSRKGGMAHMKRKLSLVAVLGGALLAFGVQNAMAGHDDNCTYKGTKYSQGASSCQTGQQFRCDDGEWKGLGVAC